MVKKIKWPKFTTQYEDYEEIQKRSTTKKRSRQMVLKGSQNERQRQIRYRRLYYL